MNLYHVMIDLQQEAKALAFAHALEGWMELLKTEGTIRSWRLMRRKLNLAADSCRDFLLEVEVDDMAQLDRAFRLLGRTDEDVSRAHDQLHRMIARAECGLYRPFPDPERAERMALI